MPIVPTLPRVVGLTGAFGSGCSTVASILNEKAGYEIFSVSKACLTPFAEEELKLDLGDQKRRALQIAGNIYRLRNGNDALARGALDYATGDPDRRVVIDCLKNAQEVDYLRGKLGKDFFMISIYAGRDERWGRGYVKNDCYGGKEYVFDKDDKRDRDEYGSDAEWGQQVLRCVSRADCNINNEKHMLTEPKYISVLTGEIECFFTGESAQELATKPFMMWMAENEAKKSKCLRRHVGASVEWGGRTISVGYNMPPRGVPTCDDKLEGICYRRHLIEDELKREDAYLKDKRKMRDRFIAELEDPFERLLIEELNKKEDLSEAVKEEYIEHLMRYSPQALGYSYEFKTLEACRSLHAEEMAILNALFNKEDLEGASLYTTTFPCIGCAKKIVEVGIKEVNFIEPYPMKEALEILQDEDVSSWMYSGLRLIAADHLYSLKELVGLFSISIGTGTAKRIVSPRA